MADMALADLLKVKSAIEPPPEKTLADWLSIETAKIVEQVSARNIAIVIPADGTRRFVLRQTGERPISVSDYLTIATSALENLVERVFSLGITCLITPVLPATAFDRGPAYVTQALQACHQMLFSERFTNLFRSLGIRVRLFGGYKLAGLDPFHLQLIASLEKRLSDETPTGACLWLLGFCPISYTHELILRVRGARETNNENQLLHFAQLCFPNGPNKADIALTYDQLRVTEILPSILDSGTDIYHLTGLPFDLSEVQLRLILYDHLYHRHQTDRSLDVYTTADLEGMQWSRKNRNSLEGLSNEALRQLEGQNW